LLQCGKELGKGLEQVRVGFGKLTSSLFYLCGALLGFVEPLSLLPVGGISLEHHGRMNNGSSKMSPSIVKRTSRA
jgi:hypothetical protein